MKKWIFSISTVLLLWGMSAKAEPIAVIAADQVLLSLFIKDSAVELKTGDHFIELDTTEVTQLIDALDRLLRTEIEPGYRNAYFNLSSKLRIEKDITQPEKRQYTLYNGDIKTDGTQAWLSKYELLELRRVLIAVQARVREI